MVNIPAAFVQTIKNEYKEQAVKWLSEFDGLIAYCESRWDMKILSSFELSYHFAAPVQFNNGEEAVIKLFISMDELISEASALAQFDGRGIVKMLDADIEKGVLLIERLRPGHTLASIEDDQKAAYIAADLMNTLWIPASESFILQTAYERENQLAAIVNQNPHGYGPFSPSALQEAFQTFHFLNKTTNKQYLLHGDLHQYNILSDGKDSWVIIDPKGLIGEREYDVIQYLLNKLPAENAFEIIEKRITIFHETLALNKERIIQWGFAHSTLAVCWSIKEDGSYNKTFYEASSIFRKLKKLFDK